jgi:hypothetical protein
MRKMKVPPCDLANAQGYKAERILPRWINPVGDGAKRVLVVMSTVNLNGLQTAQQIGLHVFNMFQPDSHANQSLAYTGSLSLAFSQLAM